MNEKRIKTLKILKLLSILKILLVGISFYFGIELLGIVTALWIFSFLVSENHLIDFCKNGKLIRYGGTVDYINSDNYEEIKQSYNAHMWTVYMCVLFMIFAFARQIYVFYFE